MKKLPGALCSRKPGECQMGMEMGSRDDRCIEHTLPFFPFFLPIAILLLAGTDHNLELTSVLTLCTTKPILKMNHGSHSGLLSCLYSLLGLAINTAVSFTTTWCQWAGFTVCRRHLNTPRPKARSRKLSELFLQTRLQLSEKLQVAQLVGIRADKNKMRRQKMEMLKIMQITRLHRKYYFN